jgi:ABC-type phosphate transport system substrate-binding protein
VYAAESSYAVVVAQDVPVDDLTLDELRRIFLFKRAFWKPGRPVRLVLPATGSPTRTFLLAQVYQRTEGELRRIILESVYTGETDQPPKVAASEEESLKLLEALPGSVALVPAEMTLPSGLKAVRIDGKRSTEPGYRLAR